MATNGTAIALRLVTSEPSIAPLPAAAPVPAPDDPIKRRIGELTADSVLTLAQAIQDWGAGGAMAAATKERTGELFLQLYTLQQSVITDDFAGLMHTYGKEILWRRNPEIFRCHPGMTIDKAQFDRGLDVMIDHLCIVLRQVTASEKVFAMARMN